MNPYLWQLYDEQGRPLPEGGDKHTVIIDGLLHGSAHVWIWRKRKGKIEVLLQKKAPAKINWPGKYEKSTGGHIAFGEQPLAHAIRRAKEELGLKLEPSQLRFIGIHKSYVVLEHETLTQHDRLIDNEFQWLYTVQLENPVITIDTEEVESVSWMPLDTLRLIFSDANVRNQYVPYGRVYYLMVYSCIKSS